MTPLPDATGGLPLAPPPAVAVARVEHAAGHKNMLQLIELRWIAVIGQITTIAAATLLYQVRLPLVEMLEVLVFLIFFNVASHLRWHEDRVVTNHELFFALLIDVGILTMQLYLAGGTTNPFAFLYLLQVILSAVLLDYWSTWIIVAVTALCMAGLALFAHPLSLPFDHARGFASLYVQGMLICFALDAALPVIFISRITRTLRGKDQQLSDMRHRAAEEEHIIRTGLLASGAAHELGTPLATLSVILGDWRRIPAMRDNPELLEEISEMQTQLQRCKAIVSGILLSAGEARGESAVPTTINTFLDDLVEDWEASRPIFDFQYDNRITPDVPIVFDLTLKQMIDNVLDNAREASPDWVAMDASCTGGILSILVRDRGPGFAPAMLANFGKPYNSSKGRPGGGLGLFLAVNVARTLGGSVSARNLDGGGAEVRLALPLASIALTKECGHEHSHE
jgi:two-component system sensor histidine kinase RegB